MFQQKPKNYDVVEKVITTAEEAYVRMHVMQTDARGDVMFRRFHVVQTD